MKKPIVVLLMLIAAAILLSGCGVTSDPVNTVTPVFSSSPDPTSDATQGASITDAPTGLPATPSPVVTGEPTTVPEPTEVPTERPDVSELEFREYADDIKTNIRSLCFFPDGTPEGYKEHVLANLFDDDNGTYWSYLNNNLDLQLDLHFTTPVYINRLDNWWYTLNKIYFYEVYVKIAGSDEFVRVVDRSQDSYSDETQDTINAGPVEIVRYRFYDNNMLNKWVQFAEIYMRGAAFSSDLFEIDYADKIIRIPEAMSGDDFMQGLVFNGNYKAYIGFEKDNIGTVTDASVFRFKTFDITDEYTVEYKR